MMSSKQSSQRPDRIAILSHSHPSISKGGAEISAYTLFQAMKDRGESVIFVACCPFSARGSIDLQRDEYAVYYDPQHYDHFFHLGGLDVATQVFEILRAERITLANFHHFFNFGLMTIRTVASQIKTVLTLHEFLAICHHHGQMVTRPSQILCQQASPRSCTSCYPEYSREQFALRATTMKESFREIDAFVSPSQFLADRFSVWGLHHNDIGVIENGLPPRHRPTRMTNEDDSEHTWTFGFFGQINPFKGVDVIVQAAEIIAQKRELKGRIRIKIHGNMVGQSEAFNATFNNAVQEIDFLTYHGPYNNESVLNLMSECDYIIMPSKWWENSPVVIQEAFAARTPIICSNIGGMAEKVVDEVSGLHFPMGDARGLVTALQKASSHEMYAKLQSGMPSAMDAEIMAENYLTLFGQIKSGTKGGVFA